MADAEQVEDQIVAAFRRGWNTDDSRVLLGLAEVMLEMENGYLHKGCASYLAEQVRGLKAMQVTELIAAAMRREEDRPRTNGELVQRLIDMIADAIEMQPYNLVQPGESDA